jgi:hypothetical protein
VHSIKKGEYARRLAEGNLGHVSLLDHYVRVSSPTELTWSDDSQTKTAPRPTATSTRADLPERSGTSSNPWRVSYGLKVVTACGLSAY